MAVYIDDFNAPFGNMVMCHMIADTTEELLQMVDKIGVARKWIQDKGTAREHFDICLSKKKKAIGYGAIEIGSRDLASITSAREEEKKEATKLWQSICSHKGPTLTNTGESGSKCAWCGKEITPPNIQPELFNT